ncbi:2-phospho-L-lactate guanylyltransferase [Agromyces larvae]|uniref:Phosphoenolpyruvate guanylyltransferase n=1 Tax=Agromyces larvae TaxID=2929802 RepID=A0ABY4BZN5_9MICO|nr:2-phospho-L-lactate guanylyltransferase [Agromyces larvae]UOE43183.1 2-phospho-L-lactate guanylyltransferase [Agromyces larvae]
MSPADDGVPAPEPAPAPAAAPRARPARQPEWRSGRRTGAQRGPTDAWTLVIPVKSPSRAKTRLAPEAGPDERAALARAFAADTVAVALATPGVGRVLVVADDPALAGAAEFVAEPEVRGLDPAIADGIAAAAGAPGAGAAPPTRVSRQSEWRAGRSSGAHPADAPPIGVLLGDLPALRADDLASALEAAARHPLAFVRDADGTGTTLATARGGVPFAPRFGPDSAARHAAAGFVELGASDMSSWPTLRRDVDTAAALVAAVALGVGPATAAELARLAASLPWLPR